MTCVGGGMSPQTIIYAKNSKKYDIRVIGVDANNNAQGRHFADKFYVVPNVDSPDYISDLLDIVKTEGVELILPGSDEEALILAKNRQKFEQLNCQIACPEYETLEILCNKSKTYKKLSEIEGVHIPAWEEHVNVDGLIDATKRILKECGGVVLKPAVARGGRDILVVSDEYSSVETVPNARELRMGLTTFLDEFSDFYTGKFPVVVMQRLCEPVHDIDMVSLNGKVIQTLPRRRVHSAAPNEGHVVTPDQKLIELAEIVIRNFKLSWLQDIDAMYDDNGTPYILEINPRPSGSFAVSIAAGVPLIDEIVSIAKKQKNGERIIPQEKRVIPFKSLKAADQV